jgi:hypothetical protein
MTEHKCYRWAYANKDGTYRSQNGAVTWTLGEWNKQEEKLEVCQNGFHACKQPLDSLEYSSYGDTLLVAEYRGKTKRQGDKFCASEMRLIQPVPSNLVRRFALDCAEHVYDLWSKVYPDDDRVRKSLDATKAYLDDPKIGRAHV